VVKRHVAGRLAAAGVVLCGLAWPAAADGLSRFEQAMKDAPAGVLSYKSAKAVGDKGFVLEDVVVTPPPDATGGAKAEPVPIKRVAVDEFDFTSIEKNEPPNFIKMRLEGIEIGPKPAAGFDLKEMTGLDKIAADFRVDYRIDGERKTMNLSRLELDLKGLARLELAMVLDGINPEAVDSAAATATLRSASLVFDDRALLSKALPAAAKIQGADPDGLVKMAKTVLEQMRTGQGPATLAVIDALASYVDDYKQPKGALRITMNPPGKASVGALGELKNPDEAIKALGLVVSYPSGYSGAKEAAPK
jgi:hypothetical protein